MGKPTIARRKKMSLTGQCLCGNISYTLDGEPFTTAVCHCTNCQRQSGAAFSVNLMVLESQLSISGELSTFEDVADSGNKVYRKFCGACGSPIISVLSGMPGVAALKAGTLNDYTAVEPALQVYCDSKQDWLDLQGLTAFATTPPPA
jgi:hypothetical protein